jgi:plastocyanin
MLKRMGLIMAIAALAAFTFTSCGGPKEGGGNENAASSGGGAADTKPAYTSAGDEGTVTGKIIFTGTAPVPKKIDMGLEPFCANGPGDKTTEDAVVVDGKLANVFVYVKSGGAVDKFSFAPPSSPVELDQRGCRYHPHVLGVQANQTIKIINSDQATHNIHPSPAKNAEWNQSQTQGAPPIEKSFARTEVLIPVKCNQHPWMRAYIGVLPHPFFAVSSDKDGTYTIKGLPPGDYTIVAYHEKYGEQTAKVTIGAKELKSQDFTFAGAAASNKSSLEVQPALTLP